MVERNLAKVEVAGSRPVARSINNMTKIEEILNSIESLSNSDYQRLRQWFAQRDQERWDRQIETDSESGKLDFLVKEAIEEKNAHKLNEL